MAIISHAEKRKKEQTIIPCRPNRNKIEVGMYSKFIETCKCTTNDTWEDDVEDTSQVSIPLEYQRKQLGPNELTMKVGIRTLINSNDQQR